MTPFQELDHETWQAQVLEAKGPVLVDFQVPGQTTFITNEVAVDINRLFGRPVRLVYADVSKLFNILVTYRIHDLPTLCLFYQGKVHKAWRGPHRVEKMLAAISQSGPLI